MPTFPVLSTGAVAQYPLGKTTSFAVEVISFLDGSDQRCLTRGSKLRRWDISLSLLTEPELAAIERFYDSMQGGTGTFSFADPFTGEVVPNCRVTPGSLATTYKAPQNGSTKLTIEELARV